MLPPQRAMRPVTPSSVPASISGASTVTRCRSAAWPISASTRRLDGHLDTRAVEAARQHGARALDVAGRHRHLHAEQQAAVHAHLLHVVHLDALLGQRGEQPLGDAGAVLAAHRHQVRRPASASRAHGERHVLLGDPARRPRPSAHDARRHARHHAAVRDHAAHHRTRGHDDVLADLRAGEDDGVGAEPAARPDAHRGLGRPLASDGLHRVLVGVVLVGDVDVGARLDVVADHDLPVADDVRPPADEAAAADGDDRVGRHLLSRSHPGRDGGAGADDGLGADVDQVLVVDGALGEEQAGTLAHAAETPTPGIVRPDRPQLGGTLPGRVDEPGQRPAQRSGEGAGPTHSGMVGGGGRRPVTGPEGVQQGVSSRMRLVQPLPRTAAPTPRRRRYLRNAADWTGGSSCSSPRSAPPGWPDARLANSKADHRVPGPAPAATRHEAGPAVVDADAAQRRDRADGAWLDRRERQAGHARLDLQLRPARACARGVRQPGERGPR